MLVEQARLPIIPLEIKFRERRLGFWDLLGNGLSTLAHSLPIHSGFAACMGIFGNGAKTDGAAVTKIQPEGLSDAGSAWTAGNSDNRVLRGGGHVLQDFRSAARSASSSGDRSDVLGFRVARTLEP